MYIGESPWGETCAQLGSDDYHEQASAECRRFIEQIRRHYGKEPEGARLFIKRNPHDFGTYLSVECQFEWDPSEMDEDLTPSYDYALAIEGDDKKVLEYWDTDTEGVE